MRHDETCQAPAPARAVTVTVTVTVDLHGLTGDEARGLVASMVAHYRGLGQVRSLPPLPPLWRLPGPLPLVEKIGVLTSPARSASPLNLALLGLGQGSRGRVVLRLIVGKVRPCLYI